MKLKKFGRATVTGVAMALASWTGAANAVPFAVGDIFASTNNGNVQHYDAAGTLLETLNTGQGGFTTGSASNGGNLYVTNFSANTVTMFAGPGDPHTASLSGLTNSTPEAIVFLGNGNILVGGVGSGGIKVYNSGGTLLSTVMPGTRVDWFDVAADQNTIYYTQENNQVRTATISGGVDTGVFANVGDFALRILSDGNILVAADADVKLLDTSGAVIRSYDVAGVDGWFALNLDPDGTSFLSGSSVNNTFYRFDIATGGAPLQTVNTGCGSTCFFGLSVFGEITAGNSAPEPATLLLVASSLLGLAVTRRRK